MGSLHLGKRPKPPARLVRRSIDECEKIQRSIEAREHYAAVMIQRAFLRRAHALDEYYIV
jgi:hypothetical protein